MRLMERITAACTTYNSEKDICRCVEKLLSQTVPIDEILIVDGGSNDKTIDLACDLDRLEKDLKGIAPVDSMVIERMMSDIRRMERADLVGMMSTEKPPELMGLLDKLRMI